MKQILKHQSTGKKKKVCPIYCSIWPLHAIHSAVYKDSSQVRTNTKEQFWKFVIFLHVPVKHSMHIYTVAPNTYSSTYKVTQPEKKITLNRSNSVEAHTSILNEISLQHVRYIFTFKSPLHIRHQLHIKCSIFPSTAYKFLWRWVSVTVTLPKNSSTSNNRNIVCLHLSHIGTSTWHHTILQ